MNFLISSASILEWGWRGGNHMGLLFLFLMLSSSTKFKLVCVLFKIIIVI
mgnify:CR=1 FL=1